jgi:hypothetical protein
MELKVTECFGSFGASDFLNDILCFKNVIDYTRAIANAYKADEDEDYDKESCVGDLSFKPMYYSVSFDGKTYVVVEDGGLMLNSNNEAIDVLIDAMYAYSSDSHTFDFIQDNIKITLDIFEHELVIEL